MDKIYLWIALAVLVSGTAIAAYNHIRVTAAREAFDKQEKENAKFAVKTHQGRVNYTTCARADGLYDFSTGACKLPATE